MFKRESEKCEFKKSSGEAIDSMKSVCGMLNKYGEVRKFLKYLIKSAKFNDLLYELNM